MIKFCHESSPAKAGQAICQLKLNYKQMKRNSILILLISFAFSLQSQEYKIPLYKGEIPNSKPSEISERLVVGEYTWLYDVTNPDISVYLPQNKYATGQAVIICPGGGYRLLSYDNYV